MVTNASSRKTEDRLEIQVQLGLWFLGASSLIYERKIHPTKCVRRAGHLSNDKQQGAIRRRLHAVVRRSHFSTSGGFAHSQLFPRLCPNQVTRQLSRVSPPSETMFISDPSAKSYANRICPRYDRSG